MTSSEDPDSGAEPTFGVELQRQLILAYTRLFLLPEDEDGSKFTTVASIGRYDLRLVEVPVGAKSAIPPLWVELYDRLAARAIDSTGCWHLHDADFAAATFMTKAKCLNRISPSRSRR